MGAQAMVKLIRSRGVTDMLVLKAMAQVPRHLFVPEASRDSAYGDHAMGIGCEQTISQPYIVALMTEALELKGGERVLEIGTGSGYQTAILAEMGAEVYSVERIAALHRAASACLEALGYHAHCKVGDGHYGWPEFAPYDAIIVTAAPPDLPQPLVEQLADGGRMVIPIGPRFGYQTLWKIVKEGDHIHKIDLGGVAFVPFIHTLEER